MRKLFLIGILPITIFAALSFSTFVEPFGSKKAQLALVIDFSKSAENTINALIANYYDLYNDFKNEHPNVKLEVAIIGYSKQSFGTKNNYVKVISKFSDDPDKAFEFLIDNPLGSSVSQNYVGQALDITLHQLKWDKNPSSTKQIITIGNGPIRDSYSLAKKVCEKAKKEDIQMNSLYVLYKENDKNHTYWLALTDLSGGQLKTIVPKYLEGGDDDYRTTSNDKKIIAENEIIMSTYVPYGAEKDEIKERNNKIDSVCGLLGTRALSSRVQFKSGPYYQGRNSHWDLVEKCVIKDVYGEELIQLGVPKEMNRLSPIEVETALNAKWIERNASLKIIRKLSIANYNKLASYPEKPAYKRDIAETILKLFTKDGI